MPPGRPVLLRPARAALLAAAVVIGALVTGTVPTASASAAPLWPVPQPFRVGTEPVESLPGLPPGSEYVALGDSYSAGYGLGDQTGLPVSACGQSAQDYPHRIAARFGLALQDVTCGGATSADVTSRHQFAGVPPQIEALSADTRLVTITIGGNDADLFGTAASCLALSRKGPVFSGRDAPSCRSTLVRNGVDQLGTKIRSRVALGIAQTLGAVRDAAPNAEVVFLGYPAIFPDAEHTPAKGCFRSALDIGTLTGAFPANSYPFTDTDVVYLHGVQEDLDEVAAAAAAAADVRYVDVFDSTQSRSACDRSGALVSGVTLDSTNGLRRIDLEPGALHPNTKGVAYLARRVESVVRGFAG
ncbi:SGNH/GDSL hydrolase family protein [Curtobacterium sp. 9128]|uniref:SGNH/GDSL hydrolase family protein n=1 Tax=Curtobacterium sp. 9128 TaxID=1793722 RepID=UPI0011A6C60B|nr:SGNH/GDSL hydrolase family protein [Curtobacterium sp. 9128]